MEIALVLPDDNALLLSGVVVNILDETRAARARREPGLGIRLDEIDEETRARFDSLLAAAEAALPQPDDQIVQSPEQTPGPDGDPATSGARRGRAGSDGGPIIGIDLGTTYTSAAAVTAGAHGRRVVVLPRDDGARSTPSSLWFPRDRSMVVGAEARAHLASDPARTVASPKRLLGRPYSDNEVQSFAGQVPYKTLAGPDGTTVVEIAGNRYAVTQLCSYLLDDIRQVAESALGQPVRRAVLAAPISFGEERVEYLQRAARMAGLEVVAVLDEPSAAALANRYQPGFNGVVGVYDFGGGTFDFSIVDVSRGDFRVLATAGDTWLGGDDFDHVLADAAANQFWRQHKVDLRRQAVEWQKLLFACEHAKRALSRCESSEIHVPAVLRTAEGMADLRLTLNRPTLERAVAALIGRSLATCNKALGLVSLAPEDLSAVYLSGGTTHIPAVQQAVSQHFGVPVRTGVAPEHAVCLGAAVHAAQLAVHHTATLPAR